jgi:hypothetical protein
MDFTFVDDHRDKNVLFHYLHKEHTKSENDSEMSPALSNLLYLAYRYFRNEHSKVKCSVTNEQSSLLLKQFMQKRNDIYFILHESKIIENQTYEITLRELSNAVAPSIKDKKFKIDKFLEDFQVLFPKSRHIIDNVIKYRGFGRQKTLTCTSRSLKCIATNIAQNVITNGEIFDRLQNDSELLEEERKENMLAFERLYKRFYDKDQSIYTGLKFIN